MRLRLNRSEVARLLEAGLLEESVAFGADPVQQLGYGVRLVADTAGITAALEGARVVVELPTAMAQSWGEGPAVGLYSETAWGLKIAVEKDFKCLEPRTHEDETDAFEHPGGTAHCEV